MQRFLALLLISILVLGGLWLFAPAREANETAAPRREAATALIGEARRGGVRLELPEAIGEVAISEAARPDAPLVLIDPGHGGRDGGATGVGGTREKDLTLAMAREVRAALVEEGQVRVALTRDGDATLTLDQRADLARRLGADLFVSIHMDAAPNAGASGVTVYSLADIASTTEAAALAEAEAERVGQVVSDADAPVEFLLTDLALRDQMSASAQFARRILRRAEASGAVPLRPTPHQFANFFVLRFGQTPGVLLEAGYITNAEDGRRLASRAGRAPLVEVLAEAIAADLARRGGA
ncbi:N-acetylmuramoyl-L-alanine amidase family protein [Sphingomicrobium astaxanthinifaciens]|uniref:N-acetylmuramoyl-L-alanine amidase family protein n=1 Tax=Sphingomicrobium astaxanthinifaciens TaxID=1227949 RepID=UPI001FCB04A7|nr:N-acetylmuramoyl-L-alanine amidase [Sphingomicrobium astaxanthinifaciens]MCJ7421760.1 N-acetylmuramoyl-L-alanine amidase [Sphingomicrobium astaxanthinifaciens]